MKKLCFKTKNVYKGNDNTETRDSGIELLRIIMMIQVIFLHLCGPGGYKSSIENLINDGFLSPIHYIIYLFMWLSSRYMMILWFMFYGYFSIGKETSLRKTISRAKKMHSPMIFYGLIITLFFIITKSLDINPVESIFNAFTPILSGTWYFMSNYILLTLIIPFINRSVKDISKKEYIYLLSFFIIVFIWRICVTDVDILSNLFSTNNVFIAGSKNFLTFLFMYLLGGYIKKYIPEKQVNKYIYLGIFFLCTFINLVLVQHNDAYSVNLAGRGDNPIIILQAIVLLLFARELKFKSKFINQVAKANIAVYLIHEHPLIREVLWETLPFMNKNFYIANINTYIIYGIISCILIFIVCNIIEQIRLFIVKKWNKMEQIL